MIRSVVLFALALMGLHWLEQVAGTFPLTFDEAQYWLWGQHPDWGYYSKPPMIGWLIHLSTALFGDGALGVRFFGPLLHGVAAFFLYRSARVLGHGTATSCAVVLSALTLPFALGSSAFFSTDAPLYACWSAALYGVLAALYGPHPRASIYGWLGAGVAAGLGLLAKYTMVAFAPSALLALMLTPMGRAQLRTVWPWAAAALAALIFMPNLIWNLHHQFVTFQHTDDNVLSKSLMLYPEEMGVFILAQFGLFGPVLTGALLYGLRRGAGDEKARVLHCFIWPLALAGCGVSLIAGAQAHWIAPAYIAATLLVVPMLVSRAPRWFRAGLIINLLCLSLYALPFGLSFLPEEKNPLSRLFVWHRLAGPVRAAMEKHPDAWLVTDERKIAAVLSYALRDRLTAQGGLVHKWRVGGPPRDYYDMRTPQGSREGRALLLVTRSADDDRFPGHLLARLPRAGMDFRLYYWQAFEAEEQ